VTTTRAESAARTDQLAPVSVSRDTAGLQLNGGPVGCLMLHGWSGHPGELRPMAEYLAGQGLSVSVPQLPGHGAAPAALDGVSFRRWVAAVTAAWLELRRDHPTSFVVGLSMGGALALDLAGRRPREVAGVVTMAALTALPGWWTPLVLPVGRHVIRWYNPLARVDLNDPKVRERISPMIPLPDTDLTDTQAQQSIRDAARVPMGSVYQLQLLLRDTRRRLPAVRAPLLVMHGRLDDFILPRQADIIYARAGAQDKQLVLLDHSHHMLPLDADHQEVWERTWRFIHSHAAAEARR